MHCSMLQQYIIDILRSPVTGEFHAQMSGSAEKFPFDDVIMCSDACKMATFSKLASICFTELLLFVLKWQWTVRNDFWNKWYILSLKIANWIL